MIAPVLMLGDCLERMAEIPACSVDMILCDLPYGTTQNKWDAVIPFEPLWASYRRVLKPNGAVVLTASQPFTSALVMSNIKQFRYSWVWEKNIASNFMDAKRKPLKVHEDICVFYAETPTYNPQMEAGKPYVQKRGGRDDTGDNYGAIKVRTDTVNTGQRGPKSIIKAARETGLHPTQKPVPLFEYLVKTYTNVGDTVLDNCMGSGTTGVACMNEDRRFIGIERDPEYFRIASDRIAEAAKRREAETDAFLAELMS
jgi:DNA modification methylase